MLPDKTCLKSDQKYALAENKKQTYPGIILKEDPASSVELDFQHLPNVELTGCLGTRFTGCLEMLD